MVDILNNNPPVNNSTTNPVTTPTPDVTAHVNPAPHDEFLVKEPPPHGLDSSWRRWKCLSCAYVYEGIFKGAMVCPKCGNADPDKFDESE
jgi:rubrerythrin